MRKLDAQGCWIPENESEQINISDWFENELDTPLFNFKGGKVLLFFETGDLLVQIKGENRIHNVTIDFIREFDADLYNLYMKYSDLRLMVKSKRYPAVTLETFLNEKKQDEERE